MTVESYFRVLTKRELCRNWCRAGQGVERGLCRFWVPDEVIFLANLCSGGRIVNLCVLVHDFTSSVFYEPIGMPSIDYMRLWLWHGSTPVP